jgi:multidrug efflux pump subunit AcrB
VSSLVVSLTLSPALCALLLKPHDRTHRDRWWERPIHGAFRLFNRGFTAATNGYGWLAGRAVRVAGIMLGVYVLIIAGGGYIFSHAPSGFIPQQDRAYLIGVIQLPPGPRWRAPMP